MLAIFRQQVPKLILRPDRVAIVDLPLVPRRHETLT